jgi:hypothetical protein
MRERKTFVRKTDRPGVSFLLTKSQEEAISFGPLYEGANVSC